MKRSRHAALMAKRKDPRPPVEFYLFKVVGWAPQYEFGVPIFAEDFERFEDRGQIIFKCEMIMPRKQRGKHAVVQLDFDPWFNVDVEGQRKKVSSRLIGLAQYSGTDCWMRAPQDGAAYIAEILAAGRFRFIEVVTTSVPRHRSEDILSFKLLPDLTDVDVD